jgi:hypothetical protein
VALDLVPVDAPPPDDEHALELLLVKLSQLKWSFDHAKVLGEGMLTLSANRAARLRKRMVSWLRSDKVLAGAGENFRSLMAEALTRAWPETLDPTPIVELVLALPDIKDPCFSVGSMLVKVLDKREQWPGPLLERLMVAQQQGFPGHWKHFRQVVEEHLERLEVPRRRRLAEQALSNSNDEVVRWGLGQLFTRLPHSGKKESRAQALERVWQQPRLREQLIHYYPKLVVPLLRRELRQGQLTLFEASQAMHQIRRLYGGVAEEPSLGPKPESEREKERREQRKEVRELLGPRSLRGPPTEVEWSAFRTGRDRGFGFGDDLQKRKVYWFPEMEVVPPGAEWHPADRAFFWRAVKFWFATRNGELCEQLLRLIALKPLREDLLILEKLHWADNRRYRRGKEYYAVARAALGLDEEQFKVS